MGVFAEVLPTELAHVTVLHSQPNQRSVRPVALKTRAFSASTTDRTATDRGQQFLLFLQPLGCFQGFSCRDFAAATSEMPGPFLPASYLQR
jgi:hypothetical protein